MLPESLTELDCVNDGLPYDDIEGCRTFQRFQTIFYAIKVKNILQRRRLYTKAIVYIDMAKRATGHLGINEAHFATIIVDIAMPTQKMKS